MAHTEEMLINGVLTPVVKFDHSAQEIDDAVEKIPPNGAAPSGYGLGEVSPSGLVQTSAALDSAKNTGWYRFYGLDNGSYWDIGGSISGLIEVKGSRTSTDGIRQLFYPDGTSGHLERMMVGGAWQPWEYENPPMQLGKEYRTTKRWNGKTVYALTFDAGIIPNNGYVFVQREDLMSATDVAELYGHLYFSTDVSDQTDTWHIRIDVNRKTGQFAINNDLTHSVVTGAIVSVEYVKD